MVIWVVNRAMLALALIWVLDGQPVLSTLFSSESCPVSSGWFALPTPHLQAQAEPNEANVASGNALSLAVDWSVPGGLYIGGDSVLYHSVDCGASWQHVWTHDQRQGYEVRLLETAPNGRIYMGSGIGQPMLSGESGEHIFREFERGIEPILLKVAPSNPDRIFLFIWYGGGNQYPVRSIRRSNDGGKSWDQLRLILPGDAAIVDMEDENIIYSFRKGIVWRSSDGANTFEEYAVYELQSAPNSEGALAAIAGQDTAWVMSRSGNEVYIGENRLSTWRKLAVPPFAGRVVQIAADPHDPRTLQRLA